MKSQMNFSDQQLERVYSIARLNAYGFNQNKFIDYHWDMSLSEALYPCLRTVEVALRNELWFIISQLTQDDYWLTREPHKILLPQEQKVLRDTQEKIKKIYANRLNEADHLVSELSFGFWTNLLNSRYEGILWPKLFKYNVFPHLPRKLRTRVYIHKRFHEIRNLRNRIFHHQRVFHLKDLRSQYNDLIDVIGWFEPNLLKNIYSIDRFNDVYTYGRKNIEKYFHGILLFSKIKSLKENT